MATTGSTGGLIVWMSQCLAFIRYRHWYAINHHLCHENITDLSFWKCRLFLHRYQLNDQFSKYNRWDFTEPGKRYSSVLAYFQPVPAWLGLIGCFLIVFVFSTAPCWNGDVTFKKVAVAFAGVCHPAVRPQSVSDS
jgi:yeast amino acid transporter